MDFKTGILLLLAAAVIGGMFYWWRAFDAVDIDAVAENGNEGTTELREPDSETPASSVCAFDEDDVVTFELADGIPVPRCARLLKDQQVAFRNRANQLITFSFAGHELDLNQGETKSIQSDVGTYLLPGVHVVAMDFYGGSGPAIWVEGESVERIEGVVGEVFQSARAIVIGSSDEAISIAITDDTRIFEGNAEISSGNFSLALVPGTRVNVIAQMENDVTGAALEIRVIPST